MAILIITETLSNHGLNDRMRRKYHPRDQEQGLKDRNIASQEEATRFALEAESDSLDVAAQGKSAQTEG